MLFSIIVPVYNLEPYLDECVQGLLSQDWPDFELILVDDGSTDGSGAWCDAFATRDRRVRVIHQPNGGLSTARNAGMKAARGEYLVFVDGDDGVQPDSLRLFAARLTERPEVLITRLVEVYPDGRSRRMNEQLRDELALDQRSAIRWVFTASETPWPAQQYLVKRCFAVEHGLAFRPGFFHEDVDWTAKLFRSATTFATCGHDWYHYRSNRAGSITSQVDLRRPLDVLDLVASNIHDERYQQLDLELRTMIFRRLVEALFAAVKRSFARYGAAEKRVLVAALSRQVDLFKYAVKPKHRCFVLLARTLGLRVSLELVARLSWRRP